MPFLQRKFSQLQLDEGASAVPYVGLLLPKVPVYRFLGLKTEEEPEFEQADGLSFELPTMPKPRKKMW